MFDFFAKNRIILTPRVACLIVAGIILTLISGFFLLRHILAPNTGLISMFPEVLVTDNSIVFAPRDPVSKSIVKSLVPLSDSIVAINGNPIFSVRDFVKTVYGIKSYSLFAVDVVRSGAGKLRLMIEPEPNILRIDWIFVLLFSLVCSLLGFFLLVKFNNSFPYILAAFISFFYTLYICVKPFYFESAVSYGLTQIGAVSPWLIVLFSVYFPWKKGNDILRSSVVVFFSTLLAAFTIGKIILFSVWQNEGSNLLYNLLGNAETLNQAMQVVVLTAFCVLCIHSYIKSQLTYEKRQLEWIVLGLILSFTPYFFFEKLPYLLFTYTGDTMSLGGFSYVFLVLLPLFFFIGIATNKALNIRVTVNRLVILSFLIIVLSLLYLLVNRPMSDYLYTYYGFSVTKSAFVLSFAYLLILFPANFILNRIFERFFDKSSSQSSNQIETRYKKLLAAYEELNTTKQLDIQTVKIWDLHALFSGMKKKTSGYTEKLKHSVIVFEKLFKRLFSLVGANPNAYQKEPKIDKEEAFAALNIAKDALIGISDIFMSLDSMLNLKPAVRSWTGPKYLVKAAIAAVEKKYPDAEIEGIAESDHKIFCIQHEVIASLKEIIFNAVESHSHAFSGVTVRVKNNEKVTVFEVSDKGKGAHESVYKKLCTPFFSTKSGHEGLGLYIAKTYIEKNEGILAFSQGEGLIVSISFPDERRK
jgi:hypothetical protein